MAFNEMTPNHFFSSFSSSSSYSVMASTAVLTADAPNADNGFAANHAPMNAALMSVKTSSGSSFRRNHNLCLTER